MRRWLAVLPVVGLALVGMGLALHAIAPYGTGITGDSVEYLAAARSMAQPQPGLGRELRGSEGGIYILWPPFYPLTLALAQALSGAEAFTAGGLLNAFLFGAAVLLGGVILLRWQARCFPGQVGWAWAGALALLVSPPLFFIAINLLSDLLFIVQTLLFLLIAGRWLECAAADDCAPGGDREARVLLVILGLLAGTAAVTRYIGVLLIALGVGVILLPALARWLREERRLADARRALLDAAAFALLALLPLAIWVGRNLALTGEPFGPRSPARWTLAQNLSELSTQLNFWFRPLAAVTALGLLLALAAMAWAFAAARGEASQKSHRLREALTDPYALPGLAFGLLYLPALVASQMTTAVTRIDQRLLAPAYFPTVLLVILLLAWIAATAKGRASWLALPAAALLLGWLWAPAQTLRQTVTDSRRDGVSVFNYLNTREFRTSQAAQFLLNNPQALPPGAVVYSNYAALVFLYTGHPTQASPFRHNPLNREETYPVEQYRGQWPQGAEAYLVWFEVGLYDHYYPPEDLQQLAELEPLFEREGAGVWRVRPHRSSP